MTDVHTQYLLDRAAISDVFHNYASGVDLRDWPLFRSCFTDDVEVDFTSAMGDVFKGADKWLADVRQNIEALDATQHIITNHVHAIDGDVSRSRSYVQAQHVLRGAAGEQDIHFLIGGYYVYDMLRSAGAWKIKRYTLTITWHTGNPAIFDIGRARPKASKSPKAQ